MKCVLIPNPKLQCFLVCDVDVKYLSYHSIVVTKLTGKNEENYQKSGWILEMCVTSDVKNEISAKDKKIYRIDI